MTNSLPNYYKQDRNELSEFIPIGEHHVLDVGCAAGFFGESIKKLNKASVVYGIEGLDHVAREASQRLDIVKVANLDDLIFEDLLDEWNNKSFDFIVFGDVLEHLKDPWSVLKSCQCLLKPEGKVIISLPNIRHWSIVLPLIFRGKWEYTPQGILDKTHFRFFTKSSASDLIKKSGLELQYINIPIVGKRSAILSKIFFGILNDLLGVQISILAKNNKQA